MGQKREVYYKSRIDLIYHLGSPTFREVQVENDGEARVISWYDSEGREINPPEVVYIRADENKTELSRALNYRLNTYSINGEEYVFIHYIQETDGNNNWRCEIGYWPVKKVYSIDPNKLITKKSLFDLKRALGNPDFTKNCWIDEYSGEKMVEWEDKNDEIIDPPDARFSRIDTNSELSRACGEGFAICSIYGKEYVKLDIGWDEFGSGAYGFWLVKKLYSIDPNTLEDYCRFIEI